MESQFLNAGNRSRVSWGRSGVVLTIRPLCPGMVKLDIAFVCAVALVPEIEERGRKCRRSCNSLELMERLSVSVTSAISEL